MTTTDTRPAPLTDEQLAEIDARHFAARDGEWKTTTTQEDNAVVYVDHESIHNAVTVLFEADWGEVADAEFIAHAHQDVPALLAEVKRLRAERDTAHAAIKEAHQLLVTVHAAYEIDEVADALAALDTVELAELTDGEVAR